MLTYAPEIINLLGRLRTHQAEAVALIRGEDEIVRGVLTV
jgi:hypothetical protein